MNHPCLCCVIAIIAGSLLISAGKSDDGDVSHSPPRRIQAAGSEETETTAEDLAFVWLRRSEMADCPIGRVIGIIGNPKFSPDTRATMYAVALRYAQTAPDREAVNDIAVEFLSLGGDQFTRAASINFASQGLKDTEVLEDLLWKQITDPRESEVIAQAACSHLLLTSLATNHFPAVVQKMLKLITAADTHDSRRASLTQGLSESIPPISFIHDALAETDWQKIGSAAQSFYLNEKSPDELRVKGAVLLTHPFVMQSYPLSENVKKLAATDFVNGSCSVPLRTAGARILLQAGEASSPVRTQARLILENLGNANLDNNTLAQNCIRLLVTGDTYSADEQSLMKRLATHERLGDTEKSLINKALEKPMPKP